MATNVWTMPKVLPMTSKPVNPIVPATMTTKPVIPTFGAAPKDQYGIPMTYRIENGVGKYVPTNQAGAYSDNMTAPTSAPTPTQQGQATPPQPAPSQGIQYNPEMINRAANTTPAGSSYTYGGYDNIMQGVDPAFSSGYNSTLSDMYSGRIVDPMASTMSEATARKEASDRAATANRISGLGLTGGIAEQVANAKDAELATSRFGTLADIEQAKVDARTGAMTETRALAGDNAVQNRFKEQQRQSAFRDAEDIRQFDATQNYNYANLDQNRINTNNNATLDKANFDQDQRAYKNTEAWKSFETALQYGSDADVSKAYQAATGKSLDGAAISKYRQYARDNVEQGLKMGALDITSKENDVLSDKKATANVDFAAYIQNHASLKGATSEQAMADPAFASTAQSLWESYGNKGPVDKNWAKYQLDAVNDPRLNNEIVAATSAIDEAVANGSMSQDSAAFAKQFIQDSMSGKMYVDWEKNDDGTYKIKGVKTADGSAVTVNVGDNSTPKTPAEEKSAYDTFKSSWKGTGTMPTQAEWTAAGSPKSSDEYKTAQATKETEAAQAVLDGMGDTSKDLTTDFAKMMGWTNPTDAANQMKSGATTGVKDLADFYNSKSSGAYDDIGKMTTQQASQITNLKNWALASDATLKKRGWSDEAIKYARESLLELVTPRQGQDWRSTPFSKTQSGKQSQAIGQTNTLMERYRLKERLGLSVNEEVSEIFALLEGSFNDSDLDVITKAMKEMGLVKPGGVAPARINPGAPVLPKGTDTDNVGGRVLA
jgi:hypothetical protein